MMEKKQPRNTYYRQQAYSRKHVDYGISILEKNCTYCSKEWYTECVLGWFENSLSAVRYYDHNMEKESERNDNFGHRENRLSSDRCFDMQLWNDNVLNHSL